LYDRQAKERQREAGKNHGRGKVVENLPQANPDPGRARDQAGKVVGVSGKTIDHATRLLESVMAIDPADVWTLVFRPAPGWSTTMAQRVRRLLKAALRCFGLKCIRVTGPAAEDLAALAREEQAPVPTPLPCRPSASCRAAVHEVK
jgi:hypothetical protein